MKLLPHAAVLASLVLVSSHAFADDWKAEPRDDHSYGYHEDRYSDYEPYVLNGDESYIPPDVAAIPPGHYPPPGHCRDWYPDRPPGHQPPPYRC